MFYFSPSFSFFYGFLFFVICNPWGWQRVLIIQIHFSVSALYLQCTEHSLYCVVVLTANHILTFQSLLNFFLLARIKFFSFLLFQILSYWLHQCIQISNYWWEIWSWNGTDGEIYPQEKKELIPWFVDVTGTPKLMGHQNKLKNAWITNKENLKNDIEIIYLYYEKHGNGLTDKPTDSRMAQIFIYKYHKIPWNTTSNKCSNTPECWIMLKKIGELKASVKLIPYITTILCM